MKLSARARYAARILLELARNEGLPPMSASTLSHRTGVSVQFVEQILKPLKQKGLTSSIRGAAGGHQLAKPPQSITLGDVIRVMEGGIKLTVCCGDKALNCPRQHVCLTRKAWVHVSQILENELDEITIARLLHDDAICPVSLDDTPIKPSVAKPPKKLPPPAPKKAPVRPMIRRVKALRPSQKSSS